MHILIATSSSPHAQRAFEYGLLVAKRTKAKLDIVHVVRKPDKRDEGKAYLKAVSNRVNEAGLEANLVLRIGLPGEQIVHLAYENEYDLLILGEGSQESLIERVLAPTAERVIANAPSPVLVVKGEPRGLGSFLFCHSGEQSLDTLHRFMRHNKRLIGTKSTVTFLHVMSQIGASHQVKDWELRAEATELIDAHTPEGEWLAEALDGLKKGTKAKAQPKVRHGLVVDEILKEMKQGDYDMVVIGAHRKGGWTDFLVDDIAKQVISRVDRPILIVK